MRYTGCSPKELRRHLESKFTRGMSWDNYGVNGWHIDHVIPCAAFDLTKEEHQVVCFNYLNLRPLWGTDNMVKGDRILIDAVHPSILSKAAALGVKLGVDDPFVL